MTSFPVGTLGCNCSIITEPESRACLVIDPGNDPGAVAKRVADEGLKVQAILHTHAHFDHIGGSSELKKLWGAPMYLHDGDRFLYDALPQQGLFFGAQVPPGARLDGAIEDDQRWGLSGEGLDPALREFLVTLHTPGHTPGSCCFYSEALAEPILFSGDTLFRQSVGRTDLPGGDTSALMRSIRGRLLQLPDETRCIPGHGPETRIFEERRSNPFVT